jgi:filamentous hemagglutinin
MTNSAPIAAPHKAAQRTSRSGWWYAWLLVCLTVVETAAGVNSAIIDTDLIGAVITASQVTGHVGGNLLVESPQDTAKYDEKSKSAGASVTIGYGGGGSVNYGQTSIHSNYTSVGEQSAIRAGDEGFQLQVDGKTELKGGAITSTQAALDNHKNQFDSKGGISVEDIQNTASYSAKSVSVGVGTSGGKIGGMAGIGSESGNASSTTQSGISGIAGNKDARTGDAEAGIKPIFDKNRTKAEVQDQVVVTTTLGSEGAKAWGTYANGKFEDAAKNGDEAGMKCWAPDGGCRAAGHAVIGGTVGGIGGGAIAAGTSIAAPHAYQALVDAGVPPVIAQSATVLGAATLGGAAGGTGGAAAATNEAANNAVLAAPLIVEGIVAAGTAAIRGCLSSPTCVNAVSLAGASTVAWMASQIKPEEPVVTPGFGAGAQPPQGSNNTGNTNPAPNYGTNTATPNNGPQQGGATVYPAPPGGEQGGNVVGGGYGAGTQPVVNPGVMASIPPSILGTNGQLPPGIGGTGTPIPMAPSNNPNQAAEDFARSAFNGQTPSSVRTDIAGPGSWLATLPDGTNVLYRPAGQASNRTDSNTATVEVNNPSIRNINMGEQAKFKFPQK